LVPAQAPDASDTPEARKAARFAVKKAIRPAPPPVPAQPETAAPSGWSVSAPSIATPSTPGASNPAVRTTPPTATTADLDPALEKALIGVLGYEDLVHQANDLCVRTMPGLMSKYDGARKGWDTRNAAVVAKARQVMQQAASPARRQLIEAAVNTTNGTNLSVVRQASPIARIAWCGRTVDEVNSGALDVHHKPNLSSPLMAHRG
jgi:hypothetical protein